MTVFAGGRDKEGMSDMNGQVKVYHSGLHLLHIQLSARTPLLPRVK